MNHLNSATHAPGVGAAAANEDSSSTLSGDLSLLPEERPLPHRNGSTDTTTTDEDESDTHSMQSRRDTLEVKCRISEPPVGGGGGGGGRGAQDRRGMSGESVGQKRNLDGGQGPLLRKACDLCTKRKRKCNGQHPCSHCIETGVEKQCVYSPRLKSGRKKKVRVDGVMYDEGVGPTADGSCGLALVPNGRGWGSGYTVDPSAGRFSASGAVGLAGHVENFFLATYLRDFNRIVPLTTESRVTEGMLEVLSPAVSSRGLSQASPIPQPESRRQAKRAVFWGVVAMGSRILNAEEEATEWYSCLMRAALRECVGSNDKEVVQAYLLLSTVETMRGHEEAGKRYLEHAQAMHNGNAIGPEGQLLQHRQEQDESLDLVFQIYGQPDGCVGQINVIDWSDSHRSTSSTSDERGVEAAAASAAAAEVSACCAERCGSSSASAVDQMIAQAMSPPTESQSGPLKALKYLSTACGLSSEVFDPTNKCVTVMQYLGEMDTALKGADSLFKDTDLSECVTGVVMVKIWGGVTVLMQSWGKQQEKEVGLAQVEEGVGYALTRPGLMTFPMWWHALHCAASVLAHFGHNDTYMRLRATFNKNTFLDTEMPPIESYSPGAICPQLGGSCSKLAYWLQVRGTMCSAPGWKPQFGESKFTEAAENAAYAAALSRKFAAAMSSAADNSAVIGGGEGGGGGGVGGTESPAVVSTNGDSALGEMYMAKPIVVNGSGTTPILGGGSLQRVVSTTSELSLMKASLDAGLNELRADLEDLGGLATLGSGELDDLDPLGIEFDLSHFKDLEADAAEGWRGGGSVDEGTNSGATVKVINGSGEMSREMSSTIAGGEVLAKQASLSSGVAGVGALHVSGGDALSRQSSLDIHTIMRMAYSDEELKQKEGGSDDAMDVALAFGEGPAKELFGVELNAL